MKHVLLLNALLIAGLLNGCKQERFGVHDRSCDENFSKWYPDLTHDLLNGTRKTGEWSYDPDGELESDRSGQYRFSTGDFTSTITYNPISHRPTYREEGYGFADPNGDLDVVFIISKESYGVFEDVSTKRIERVGCDMTLRDERDDGWWVEESGRFESDVYTYDQSNGQGYTVTGTKRPDGTHSQHYSRTNSNYESDVESDADGYTRIDFSSSSDNTSYTGYAEDFLDGSRHFYSADNEGTTWEYTIDWQGNGGGTVNFAGEECAVSYAEFACSYTCSDKSGPC